MQGTKTGPRYESVNAFVEKNGLKKGFVAKRWDISPFQMTALLYPGRYRFALSTEQWERIAKDLNQPADDLRKQYEPAAVGASV